MDPDLVCGMNGCMMIPGSASIVTAHGLEF